MARKGAAAFMRCRTSAAPRRRSPACHARLHAEGCSRRNRPGFRRFRLIAAAARLSRNPLDLLKQPAGEGWIVSHIPRTPGGSSPGHREKAAVKLAHAANPVVVLGGGALHAGSAASEIAENLGAIILTTTAGKGAVPENHPLCHGYRLSQLAAQQLLKDADVVLCAGSELSETDFWGSDFVLDQGLIRIDIDASNLARPHRADIAILADSATALAAIARQLPKADHAARRATKEKQVRERLTAEPGKDEDLRKLLRKTLAVIRDALPADTVVASDMTQIAYAANEIFPIYEPRSWLHPVGFGTLGFALPAGIGAKFGCPRQAVAVMIGDYGIQ